MTKPRVISLDKRSSLLRFFYSVWFFSRNVLVFMYLFLVQNSDVYVSCAIGIKDLIQIRYLRKKSFKMKRELYWSDWSVYLQLFAYWIVIGLFNTEKRDFLIYTQIMLIYTQITLLHKVTQVTCVTTYNCFHTTECLECLNPFIIQLQPNKILTKI